MKYDLHVHSRYSRKCGWMEPEKIVKIARKCGLAGIAITDHQSIQGGLKTETYASEDFQVVVGSEVLTDRGEIIGLFLSEEIKPGEFFTVADEIKDQGGLIVVPHPFDRFRRGSFHPSPEDAKYFDCVEGYNSRCLLPADNRSAACYALDRNIPCIAGSDAHHYNEIGNSYILAEGGDLRSSLSENRFKISYSRSSLLNHIYTKVIKFSRI